MKSFYHQLLVQRKFHKNEIDLKDSAWHIVYNKKSRHLTSYRDAVFDTIKRAPTYEKLGLNYHDLMKLTVPEFNKIRDLILEIDQAISDSNSQATKRSDAVMKSLEKNLKK